MTEKQNKLEDLIVSINDMHYLNTYDKKELSESDFLKKQEKINDTNQQTLIKIQELIDSGIDLTFKTQNGRTVMDLAVVKNNVPLIELLIARGVPLEGNYFFTPLYRAAESGADRVVKFLIEEKGINPRKKARTDFSVLAAARSARHSKSVLPYLIEVMKKTKSQRLPAPKKPYELTEENVMKWLPQIEMPANIRERLHEIVESIFIEEHSITLSNFYADIEHHDPELIFAAISLIVNATTATAVDKTIKKIAGQSYSHFGNLEISGNISIKSLLVTGNLSVKGKASNVQGCQLIVGGDFTCDSLYTEGPVVIGGSLKAHEVEAYYNDYALEVKNTLEADRLIIDRHQVKAGRFNVKERIVKNE